MKLEVGDIVVHRVPIANKWGFGIVKEHHYRHSIYRVIWSDGTIRTHTIELLKRIA